MYSPYNETRKGSIGVPIPYVDAAVLDPEKDEFLPLGEIGEIAVWGPHIMLGYWRKPEAVKEVMSTIKGKTWYRTGDLGRMDEDGYFYIYDRKRDIIKYKGYRVHARDVEEVLKRHPAIKEAGVVAVLDQAVGENVKAFVVVESDQRGKISESDIEAYCRENLAHYKVPKIIEFCGELPKTDVGKVSRRELREMELD
jgi:long-chain acyl-CoA synthetase